MSDETETVEAGSETSGETAVDTTATEQSGTAETTTTDAGAAAEETSTEGSETSGETADESRTGYAKKGLRAGDECICPDGRKGTVHSFDAGLICIPNADQGE
jgi:hypothetical protein